MLLALLMLAGIADWVPVRWESPEPKAIEVLRGGPVNCLLVERPGWSAEMIEHARSSGIVTLAVVRPVDGVLDDAGRAVAAGFDGLVLEGDFQDETISRLRALANESKLNVLELPSRARMRFDARPVTGTFQGVWPGVRAEEEGSTHAAPSGAPWIDTNGGFLRFVRSAAPDATVWIANRPAEGNVITAERYMGAIADAAIVGARWVIALDSDFSKRLYAGDAAAVREWQRISAFAAYFEQHPEWRSMRPLSELALVQDTDSGALFSGGVLDMIATKHTPVRPVPSRSVSADAMRGAKMAVNVAPSSLTEEQKQALRAFSRAGGTTLSGPASWKFPAVRPDQITLSADEVKTLDEIWKEMNSMTGRRNLGVRLFNVSSMLSNLLEYQDGSKAVLHLVNYSGYSVENVTVHLLKKYKTATLLSPGAEPKKIAVYENEDGSGVDVDSVEVAATLVLE